MTQEAAIGRCRSLIEDSLGWGDAASWTNEDFATLSERLFETTGVRLSVSTLKRVWGKVKYDSSPTLATLNTLARYAGFEGWRDFLQRASAPPALQEEPMPEPAPVPIAAPPAAEAPKPIPKVARRSYTTRIIVISVTIVAVVSLLSARLIHHGSTVIGPPRFEARRISEQLPNSVVFDYDATSFHPHSVMIQQSWDPTRRESVAPDGKQHTSLYFKPGYFRAKLVVDNEIKMQTDVFVPSGGWKGIVDKGAIPVYLKAGEIRQDSGSLGVTSATLREKLGTGVFSGNWVDFCNIRQFPGITGEQFTLEATVRNTSTVEECLCRKVQIIVLGKVSAIVIPLCDKGCISDIGLFPGSKGISGKDHDLSAFGCDFSQWQRLRCTVDHGHFGIQLNGKTIFEQEKVPSIGDIVGVRVDFEGTGMIRQLDLRGGPGDQDTIAGKSRLGQSQAAGSPQGGAAGQDPGASQSINLLMLP